MLRKLKRILKFPKEVLFHIPSNFSTGREMVLLLNTPEKRQKYSQHSTNGAWVKKKKSQERR